MHLSHRVERFVIAVGVISANFLVMRVYSNAASGLAPAEFESGQTETHAKSKAERRSSVVDFSLWSEERVSGYKQSLAKHFQPPMAILQIPKIHLNVPVFNGTDELVLNRGVGRIIGTARLGGPGNMGIAGHRDGFFRGLKDIGIGTIVKLVNKNGQALYEVKRILIVTPDDVNVLKDAGTPTLTLVTCYPFYFVGDAPQRYIVQCLLISHSSRQS
ncbi:MAG TPA: class D sortase [Bryobacteraceae bacterium]|jgi:sortase A